MKKFWNKLKFKWRWFWMCEHDRAIWNSIIYGFSMMENGKTIKQEDIFKISDMRIK